MGNSDFYTYLFIVLVLLFVIVVPVQWGANAYFGTKGGIVSCLGLSLIGAFVCLFAYQWGRGVGSVTGNVNISQAELLFVFASAFIVCLLLAALANFGVYHLVQFRKTGELNKVIFYTWLAISLGVPVLYFGGKELKSYLAAKEQRVHFIKAELDIRHHHQLPVSIDQLKFVNTSNGRETVFGPFSACKFSPEEQEYKGDRYLYPYYVVLDESIRIPVGTDKFFMSWYSFVEDKYYSDEFPFVYEQFAKRVGPDGSGIMGGIVFCIKPEGKVDALGNYNKYLAYYSDVATKVLAQEEKDEKLEALRAQNLQDVTKEELAEILNQLSVFGRAKNG